MRFLAKRSVRAALSVLVIASVFSGGFIVGSSHPASLALAQNATPADSKLFAPFWEAWNLMHTSYVDPVDDNALMQGAINGMMAVPGDKFTNYFDPQFYKSTTEELAGQFSGIGATVKKDDKTGALIIISTIAGSPARTTGLLAGDYIVTVDNNDITLLTENEIVAKVRGAVGTVVKLGILRGGKLPQLTIAVTRGEIVLQDVVTRMYPNNIGYISLAEFGDHASRDFENGLIALNANKLKGLIFDLRGNPGGYVQAAISVASEFITSGPILIERERGNAETTEVATGHALAPKVPIIVLVDGGSASAAEIVSGALQDYGRAKLLGTQTYGKGSAQIVQPLTNGGAAHITIAHWFTPKGHTIQKVGLTPDYIVGWDAAAQPDQDMQIQQAILILSGEL